MTGSKNGSRALKGMLPWHWEKLDGSWKIKNCTSEIPKA